MNYSPGFNETEELKNTEYLAKIINKLCSEYSRQVIEYAECVAKAIEAGKVKMQESVANDTLLSYSITIEDGVKYLKVSSNDLGLDLNVKENLSLFDPDNEGSLFGIMMGMTSYIESSE